MSKQNREDMMKRLTNFAVRYRAHMKEKDALSNELVDMELDFNAFVIRAKLKEHGIDVRQMLLDFELPDMVANILNFDDDDKEPGHQVVMEMEETIARKYRAIAEIFGQAYNGSEAAETPRKKSCVVTRFPKTQEDSQSPRD